MGVLALILRRLVGIALGVIIAGIVLAVLHAQTELGPVTLAAAAVLAGVLGALALMRLGSLVVGLLGRD